MNKLAMILGLALAVAAPAFADDTAPAAGAPSTEAAAPAKAPKAKGKHGKRGSKKGKKASKEAAPAEGASESK